MTTTYFSTKPRPVYDTGVVGRTTSVWITPLEGVEPRPFRCTSCGKIVFEHYGDVRIMLPGNAEVAQTPLVIQCHGTLTVKRKDGSVLTSNCRARYYVE